MTATGSQLQIHNVFPSTLPSAAALLNPAAKPISLEPTSLVLWSCHFWVSYVLLQFTHLQEDCKLLQWRQWTLCGGRGGALIAAEKQHLQQQWDAYWSGLLVNACNLPLSLRWYAPHPAGSTIPC
jgi:hypothetical protein